MLACPTHPVLELCCGAEIHRKGNLRTGMGGSGGAAELSFSFCEIRAGAPPVGPAEV